MIFVTATTSMSHSSDRAPYGGRLMFAQSWEDPSCDRRALRIQPGDTLLAITSGGDNALGFLLDDPARVISVDLNPLQGYLLELKMAGMRRLSHPEFLTMLGVRPTEGALDLYATLRSDLSEPARTYFDSHGTLLQRGLLLQGGFERYYAILRNLVRLAVGRRRIQHLFGIAPSEQRSYYHQEWNTARWRALVRIGCSRWLLGRSLDPSWFQDAEAAAFGEHFRRLGEHAIVDLPARTNYFLAQILLGRYVDEELVPDYLRSQNFAIIRERLSRLEVVTADIGDAVTAMADRSVDAFALSNVFEYSPIELFEVTKKELVRVARPGARFALRNLLAPRRFAGDDAFEVDEPLRRELQSADRGFIYSRFEAASLRAHK